MTKLQVQYEDLNKALGRLKEAAKLPSKVVIHQDATIQRFEFTFEICWKIMQTIVNENIKNVYGPKNVIREGAKLGLVENPAKWFEFLENRNLTVHTYKEEVAQMVYKSAKEFIPYVEKLIKSIKRYIVSI